MTLTPIAHMRSAFPEKFGIPRQSALLPELRSTILFTPPFRNADALRGLEDTSHIWLIWGFSENKTAEFSPTVRPPRLGGNARLGVFATRSPFRPNGLGLSCVELAGIDWQSEEGPRLHVLGADLMDGTPIFDIKPYLPYTDAPEGARSPFAAPEPKLAVNLPETLAAKLPEDARDPLRALLALDPRPSYQNDPERSYGLAFQGFELRFSVKDGTVFVTELFRREA